MDCASCGGSNPEGQRFCNHCGTPLVAACPGCGAENQPGSRFCGSCGSSLDGGTASDEPARPSAERRFISALFADLVGFTSMTEGNDAEDVRSMLTVYFERARAVIERFGGEVDKFIGDAITAFWGTTVTNEDDAERAVRAGLELVDLVDALGEELGLDLALRVGVLSGETAVGEGGNQHGLVIGDIVNTAARIQSAAEPGTVYVGESTRQLTAGALAYRDAGSIEAKGKADPVPVFRAEAILGQRGGAGRWETLEPPFVGREDELRFLKDQLHATSRDRSARLVSIVGEPGIGKSRIAWELLKYIDGVTEVFRWHQGRSPAYGEGVTFWALAEMVRSRAGISDDDAPPAARIRLRTAVAEVVPDPDEQAWIEPKLAGLIGLEDTGHVTRGELFSAIRTFFQRLAATDTVVMLFEDLHWADSGQLEFIEELVELSRSSPILVITLARPDLIERRSDWGTARSHFASLHLGALADAEMGRLVRGVVSDADDGLVEAIVARAGGVPLYAVEFLRALVDAGSLVADGATLSTVGPIDDVVLPDSLHAMVGSRLDRLDPVDRALVQDCAILGQSFTPEGLMALTGLSMDELGPRLRELTKRELLRLDADPLSAERGQYQFVQGVIREVAYGRIAKADRFARHVRVAEYFEEAAPVEAAAVVADHYLRAFEIQSDDDLANRARSALYAAAERARGLGSYAQALRLAEEAIGVPGSEADRLPLRALASEAASATLQHDRAIAMAERALEWADRDGSDAQRWVALHVLGLALIEADRPADACTVLEPVFDATKVDHPEMARLGSVLANAAMREARWQEAADVAVPVMVAAERASDMETLVEAMTSRGTVLPQLGRYHEGVALLRESARLAGETWSGLRARNNLLLYTSTDGLVPSNEAGRAGFDLALKVGHAALGVRLLLWAVILDEIAGDFEAALEHFDLVDSRDEGAWALQIEALRQRVLWRKTGDREHLRISYETAERLLQVPEKQYRDAARDQLAQVSLLMGHVEDAWEYADSLGRGSEAGILPAPWAFRDVALQAAIRSRDPQRVAAARLFDIDPGGRRRVLEGLADLAADILAARPMGQDRVELVLEDVERTDGRIPAAEWRAEIAGALGDAPLAKQLAKQASDVFREVGDLGNLGRYADLFAELAPDAATGT